MKLDLYNYCLHNKYPHIIFLKLLPHLIYIIIYKNYGIITRVRSGHGVEIDIRLFEFGS